MVLEVTFDVHEGFHWCNHTTQLTMVASQRTERQGFTFAAQLSRQRICWLAVQLFPQFRIPRLTLALSIVCKVPVVNDRHLGCNDP